MTHCDHGNEVGKCSQCTIEALSARIAELMTSLEWVLVKRGNLCTCTTTFHYNSPRGKTTKCKRCIDAEKALSQPAPEAVNLFRDRIIDECAAVAESVRAENMAIAERDEDTESSDYILARCSFATGASIVRDRIRALKE